MNDEVLAQLSIYSKVHTAHHLMSHHPSSCTSLKSKLINLLLQCWLTKWLENMSFNGCCKYWQTYKGHQMCNHI